MQRKHHLTSRFFSFFRWYLVLLALVAHIAFAGVIILVLVLGPGDSIEYAKLAVHKAKAYAKGEVTRMEKAREANVQDLLGVSSPDVYHFHPLTDTRSVTLGYGRVLRVGPGAKFERPSLASKAARDGDIIEITGGTYPGDTAVWTKNDLLIRSRDGVTRLDAKGIRLSEDKAIWVIRGNNIHIENIEFTNAQSKDKNGAGIRAEGNKLQITSCYFHDNESGVMTSNNIHAHLSIEYSEFARNGHKNGQAHQIYVGTIDEFILTGSYVHETVIGSAVKSRARKSVIQYNRIVDEGRGRSNYTVDLSNGGEAYLVGNTLQQSPFTENYTLVTYAPEGIRWERNKVNIVHNTIVNDRKGGNFFRNHSQIKAQLINNLLIGEGSPSEGPSVLIGNMVDHGSSFWGSVDESLGGLPGSHSNKFAEDIGLADRPKYNYQLRFDSSAIDSAIVLPEEVKIFMKPFREYHHPLQTVTRIVHNHPDIGAHEYIPKQ